MMIANNKPWIYAILIGLVFLFSPKQTLAFIEVQEVETSSGVSAWLVEDRRLPIVTISLSWRGGSALDPQGQEGLSSLMASLMNEGAGDRDSLSFQEEMARLGARISFNASRDQISATIQLITQNRDETVALAVDAINAPRFDDEAISRMKGEALASLRYQQQSPSNIAQDAWFARAFAGHGYAHPSNGTQAGILAITQDGLLAHHRAIFAKENAVVSIVGDMSATTARTVIEKIFAKLPSRALLNLRAAPKLQANGDALITRDGPQTQVVFGLPGIGINDPDLYPSLVMNHILGGGGFSSRLMDEVREKRGLTYSISSGFIDLDAGPIWVGRFASDNSKVGEALETVKNEIRRISQEPIGVDELNKAKTYLTGSYALRFDSGRSITNQLTAVQIYGWSKTHFENRNAKIEAVTSDDILRVAKRVFNDQELIIQFVGRPRLD